MFSMGDTENPKLHIRRAAAAKEGVGLGHEIYGGLVKKARGNMDFTAKKQLYGGRPGRTMALKKAAGFLAPVRNGEV